jgi:threonine dehydrogenase-like Zn-dependent dehydrogenase
VGPQYFHHHAARRYGDHTDAVQDRRARKIDPKRLITHRFKLDNILDAYETFGSAAKTKALKVIIEA